MIDDTKEPVLDNQGSAVPRPPIRLAAHVDEILSAKITRGYATQWAQNLLYLTFDDSVDEGEAEPVVSGDSNAQLGDCQPCQQFQQLYPTPSPHLCYNHICRSNRKRGREGNEHKPGDPCFHVDDHSCHECRPLPLFPTEKVTRFRLRRFRDFCDHFVAVSYCWSNEKQEKEGETKYKVMEEDGTIRNVRASNKTIDRAVAFARENGYRLIWIDQECIEQNDPLKKEMAIQAMDYVYATAHTTIGLFSAELQQKHFECLSLVLQSQFPPELHKQQGGQRGLTAPIRPIDPNILVDAVSLIINDRWNTRAWVLQEAFTSSDRMILLFPKLAGVGFKDGRQLVCPRVSLSELAIDIDTLRRCLRIAGTKIHRVMNPEKPAASTGHISRRPRRHTRVRRSEMRRAKEKEEQELKIQYVDAAVSALERVRYFHPGNTDHSVTVWINISKPRRTCSAATALTYLRMRDLERVADKLAIVANLCDYQLRLNTTELEKTQQSLATCMLVLSLANGDFTLLTPQLYRELSETSTFEHAAALEPEFTWLQSHSQNIQQIDSDIWNPFGWATGLNIIGGLELSRSGLSLTGSLWKVDQFIAMTAIQIKHADAWMNLCKQNRATSSFQRSIRLATTHLLFEILQILVRMNQHQVADSIWNSVSNWRWLQRQDKAPHTMVESVAEFPPGLQVQDRRGMFSLDPSPDGRYHQCWIIDRIMEQGGLWAGRFVGATTQDDIAETKAEQEADSQTSQANTNTTTIIMSDQRVPSNDESPRVRETHLGRMTAMSMMTMLSSHISATESNADEQPPQNVDELSHLGLSRTLGVLVNATTYIETDDQDEEYRRTVFDIDGGSITGNLVLVPFQLTLESIPRPPLRSLSVSWVVEPISGDRNAEHSDTESKYEPKLLKVRDMVKGMWRFASFPSGKYTLV